MPYTQHQWLARLGTGLSKMTDLITGQLFNFQSTPDTITQEGTPISPEWLNEMEQGIYDANALVSTAPTTSTVGALGQVLLVQSAPPAAYMCTAIDGSTYTWTPQPIGPVVVSLNITLLASAWEISDTVYTQTISVDGIALSGFDYVVSPDPTSWRAYGQSGIYMLDPTVENSVTFIATRLEPDDDLSVNILRVQVTAT